MIPKYKIGDKIIVTRDSNDFHKGDITTITNIERVGTVDPLYITPHSAMFGIMKRNFKLLAPNWKRRLGE